MSTTGLQKLGRQKVWGEGVTFNGGCERESGRDRWRLLVPVLLQMSPENRKILYATRIDGGKLVIPTKQAFLLQKLRQDKHLDIFDIRDEDVLVFRKDKNRTQAWEEEVHEETKTYTGSDLNDIQDNVVLVASYYDMNEVMKIKPEPGSLFILSQSEAFDEEGEIQHERLLNWCEHMGLPQYKAHASGHIGPNQLKNAIKEINPETVYPVHTERPNQFKKFVSDLDCKVKLPK